MICEKQVPFCKIGCWKNYTDIIISRLCKGGNIF